MLRRNLPWVACSVALASILGAAPSSPDASKASPLLQELKLPAFQLLSWLSSGSHVVTPHPPVLRRRPHLKCGNAADPNGTPCP